MSDVVSIDPRTGQVTEVVASETPREVVEQVCDLAAAAAPALESLGRAGRARLLRGLADALEGRATTWSPSRTGRPPSARRG